MYSRVRSSRGASSRGSARKPRVAPQNFTASGGGGEIIFKVRAVTRTAGKEIVDRWREVVRGHDLQLMFSVHRELALFVGSLWTNVGKWI